MHKVELTEETLRSARARRGRLHIYDRLDGPRTALLVVDLQNAFMQAGMPAETPIARAIVPNVNRMARAVRAAGGRVVWIQMTLTEADLQGWKTYFDGLSRERGAAMIRHLTPGTEGHALHDDRETAPEDLRVSKSRFSAFSPPASELDAMLRGAGIDTVLIAGTLTNTCCEATARDAMAANYRTIMLSDANATRSDAEHNATLRSFLLGFGDVYSTEEATALFA